MKNVDRCGSWLQRVPLFLVPAILSITHTCRQRQGLGLQLPSGARAGWLLIKSSSTTDQSPSSSLCPHTQLSGTPIIGPLIDLFPGSGPSPSCQDLVPAPHPPLAWHLSKGFSFSTWPQPLPPPFPLCIILLHTCNQVIAPKVLRNQIDDLRRGTLSFIFWIH